LTQAAPPLPLPQRPTIDATETLRDAFLALARDRGLPDRWVPDDGDCDLVELWGPCRARLAAGEAVCPKELAATLNRALDRGVLPLIRTAQANPRDGRVLAELLLLTEPIVLAHARKLRRHHPSLLGLGGGRLDDGAAREALQDFCLFLLERDGHVLRRFQGTSYPQWQAFVVRCFHRRRVQVTRDARSGLRAPSRPYVALEEAEDGGGRWIPPDWPQPALRSPEEAAELGQTRRALDRALLRYESRGTREARDVRLLRAKADGASLAELSEQEGLGIAGIEKALTRVRRFLRARLGEGGEP
jgi:hypothetical protein